MTKQPEIYASATFHVGLRAREEFDVILADVTHKIE